MKKNLTESPIKNVWLTERELKILYGIAVGVLGFSVIVCWFSLSSRYKKPVPIFQTITDNKPSYDYLKSVTVQIYGESEDLSPMSIFIGEPENQKWGGTGVIIKIKDDYTYILTNNHVAGKETTNPSIYIKTETKLILSEVVAYHNTLDMAILKIRGQLFGKQAIKGVASANPQDRVFLVGHHLGRPYIYGEGVFAGYEKIWAIVQIPCAYGNSGSGVFDKDGNLVALIFGVNRIGLFDIDVAHALAIDGLNIEMFLKQNRLL